jgi:hypothetical protein
MQHFVCFDLIVQQDYELPRVHVHTKQIVGTYVKNRVPADFQHFRFSKDFIPAAENVGFVHQNIS